jgi:hypothetical protein
MILYTREITPVHRDRPNLGGVTVGPEEVDYERVESMADVLLECAKHLADLDILSHTDAAKQVRFQEKAIIQESLERWIGKDVNPMISTPSSPALLGALQIRGYESEMLSPPPARRP